MSPPDGGGDIRRKAQFPAKLRVLFAPKRYKIVRGGRGGAKSWGIAMALLILGAKQPTRVVCCRELQVSIKDSVYQLLCNQIKALGLEAFYTVRKTEIEGANGSLFTFHGLRHNIDNIKSLEGADVCWIEEANTVSKESWKKLVPTIRKAGSEIWASYNPELETDEVYRRFDANNLRDDAVLVEMNWRDNPWFPAVLEAERLESFRTEPDEYLTTWEGKCRQTLTGAVYADEIRKATLDNRITRVPYVKTVGVSVAADLGWGDNTSLWFSQRVALQHRMLASYQNSHKPWSHYLEIIQKSGYLIDTIYLPHDAANGQLGSGKSIERITRDHNYRVVVVPRGNVVNGINAVREMFDECWFDTEGTSDGLQALRRYVWAPTAQGRMTREPLHDENSHYADAFRTLAMGYKDRSGNPAERIKKQLDEANAKAANNPGGWMHG